VGRPVPFGAPKDVDNAQRKVLLTAAKIANIKVRNQFLSQDNDLTRAIRRSKKKSLETMRTSWSPLVADWHYGLTLRVRDGDVKWLVKAEYADWLQELCTDAITEAILIHKQDWVSAMLNDAFCSEAPYYQISDMPNRIQRLWRFLRRR
jgi:hypothetical protein